MGKYFTKISVIISILSFTLTAPTIYGDSSAILSGAMVDFTKPFYNPKTNQLEYIITGKDAKIDGALYKIYGVKIQIIGDAGKAVVRIISTPEAEYNQATGFISGDKKITFESLECDATGIGFDANQTLETIHIRNDVKIIFKNVKKNNLKTVNAGTKIASDNQIDSNKIQEITKPEDEIPLYIIQANSDSSKTINSSPIPMYITNDTEQNNNTTEPN